MGCIEGYLGGEMNGGNLQIAERKQKGGQNCADGSRSRLMGHSRVSENGGEFLTCRVWRDSACSICDRWI